MIEDPLRRMSFGAYARKRLALKGNETYSFQFWGDFVLGRELAFSYGCAPSGATTGFLRLLPCALLYGKWLILSWLPPRIRTRKSLQFLPS